MPDALIHTEQHVPSTPSARDVGVDTLAHLRLPNRLDGITASSAWRAASQLTGLSLSIPGFSLNLEDYGG